MQLDCSWRYIHNNFLHKLRKWAHVGCEILRDVVQIVHWFNPLTNQILITLEGPRADQFNLLWISVHTGLARVAPELWGLRCADDALFEVPYTLCTHPLERLPEKIEMNLDDCA